MATIARIKDIAAEMAPHCTRDDGKIDEQRMHLMLFFVQGYHLLITGNPITRREIIVTKDGPYCEELHRILSKHKTRLSANPYTTSLTPWQRTMVDIVCKELMEKTTWDLLQTTHSAPPDIPSINVWSSGRQKIKGDELSKYFLHLFSNLSSSRSSSIVLSSPEEIRKRIARYC